MVLGAIIGLLATQCMGFLWYSSFLFGGPWLRSVHPGKTEAQVGKESQWAIPIAMLAYACLVILLHYAMGGYLGITSVERALVVSALLSSVVILIDIPHCVFSQRSLVGFFVDHAYDAVTFIIMTTSISYFG